MARIKEFWEYLTDHWKIGKDETNEETARRILRECGDVVRNVESNHWNAICARLSKELLENLAQLCYEMQQGKVPAEVLPARLSPIFATVILMKRTEAVLIEGEQAEQTLEKIVAEKLEQAGYPSSEVPTNEI